MVAWGKTDIGRKREVNQDSFFLKAVPEENQVFCVVCDGMGGANAGNIASTTAVEVFKREIGALAKPEMARAYIRSILSQAVSRANQETFRKSSEKDEYSGMGTTLVAAVIDGTNAVFCNIGDSRAYIVSDSGISRITRDHSVVEEMVQKGELTRDQAKEHPGKNLITRALGTDISVEPDFFEMTISAGETVLFCTDGLSNLVDESEILEAVSNGDISDCPDRLIELANSRGGNDNITVVVVKM